MILPEDRDNLRFIAHNVMPELFSLVPFVSSCMTYLNRHFHNREKNSYAETQVALGLLANQYLYKCKLYGYWNFKDASLREKKYKNRYLIGQAMEYAFANVISVYGLACGLHASNTSVSVADYVLSPQFNDLLGASPVRLFPKGTYHDLGHFVPYMVFLERIPNSQDHRGDFKYRFLPSYHGSLGPNYIHKFKRLVGGPIYFRTSYLIAPFNSLKYDKDYMKEDRDFDMYLILCKMYIYLKAQDVVYGLKCEGYEMFWQYAQEWKQRATPLVPLDIITDSLNLDKSTFQFNQFVYSPSRGRFNLSVFDKDTRILKTLTPLQQSQQQRFWEVVKKEYDLIKISEYERF